MDMAALRKSGYGGDEVREEKRVDLSSDGDDDMAMKVLRGQRKEQLEDINLRFTPAIDRHLRNGDKVAIETRKESSSEEPNSKITSSSIRKDQDDRLESAKAEMGQVKEENQRLKMYLNRIMKDYQTLQMQFHDIVQQEAKKSTNTSSTSNNQLEGHDLVSLSLGRTSSDLQKTAKSNSSGKSKLEEHDKEGLTLGLDCKFDVSKTEVDDSSPNPTLENSVEVKENAEESWPPKKVMKTIRSEDDEVSQQNPIKKARVSVRVRCDTLTMSDGCNWRKYGQKIAKGNPCPRAYYRCTVAPSCPVRKQVQRCAEDMSILITTYEGTHNHPLPISATAIASTTSAAASMLLSGSSTSTSDHSSLGMTTTTTAGPNALNFYLSDDSKWKQFYPPISSISSTPSFPTVTLDLTSNSSLFNRTNFPPRYSSTNLSFSSVESKALPLSWNNGVLSYGTQPHEKAQIGSLTFGRQTQENIIQSYMQNNFLAPNHQQSLPPDTIAAATKAIASNPSFQSALAAALKSIINGSNGSGGTSFIQGGGDKVGQNSKLTESFPIFTGFSSTSNAKKCASDYLNKSSS